VAPPFKRCEFDIMFGEGISKSGEIIDLGVEYGIITKSGSWFSYNGSKLAQGRDAAKQVIADNPELAEELEALIMQALKEAETDRSKRPSKSKSKSKGKDKDKEAEPEVEAAADDDDVDIDADADDIDDFDDELPDDFSIEEDI